MHCSQNQQSENNDDPPGPGWISDWLNKSEAGDPPERWSPAYEPTMTKEQQIIQV